MVTDLWRKAETRLIDENLPASAPDETIFASRVCAPRALPRPVASLCRWMPICWWELLPRRRSRGTPSGAGGG